MTNYHARAVNAEGNLTFLPNHLFRFVLGTQVRMVQLLGFLEHVFAENPLEQPGSRDGRHVMEVFGAHCLGSTHRSPSALDVGRLLSFFVCPHVVHGGEVKEVVDFPFQGFQCLGVNTQIFAGQVAYDSLHLGFIRPPPLAQFVQLVLGLFTHQNVDSTPTCQKLLHEETANKSGATRQEIIHRSSTLPVALLLSILAGTHTTKVLEFSGNAGIVLNCNLHVSNFFRVFTL